MDKMWKDETNRRLTPDVYKAVVVYASNGSAVFGQQMWVQICSWVTYTRMDL